MRTEEVSQKSLDSAQYSTASILQYESVYGEDFVSPGGYDMAVELIGQLALEPGSRVLDVGCGVGNDLSRFVKAGARVTGIDLAEHSIELAKRNFEFRELPGKFLVMNGEDMELPDASFDVVFCHTVLHFTPDPEKMIAEILRVLRPGGMAILMTVNRNSWLNFLHRLLNVEIDHLDSPIFYKYSIKEFRAMLSGFESVEIVPERFPVRTKVHHGIKAKLFNLLFVDLFNALPKRLVRRTGHHLMAFAYK